MSVESETKPLAEVLGDEPSILRARADLDQVRRMRLVARGLEAGFSQAQIAGELGLSQPTVSRMARQIRSSGGRVLAETATEIINERTAGEIDDETMMARLFERTYTSGRHDPSGGDGYLRGTWDELADAAGRRLLSREEYNSLVFKASMRHDD